MKITYVIYLIDIDPDTGFVSQMKAVAYTESEGMAEVIKKLLNSDRDSDDPNRTYNYQKLYE